MIEAIGAATPEPADINRILAEMEELLEGCSVDPVAENALPLTSHLFRADTKTRDTIAQRHPEWPQIRTSVFYAPHERCIDLVGMADTLHRSDIVLIEAANGGENNGLVRDLQTIANNDALRRGPGYIDSIVRTNKFEDTRDEFYVRALYGTHKKVSSIDLTVGDPLTIGDLLASDLATERLDGSYDSALDARDKRAARLAEMERRRQQIIAPRLETKIAELLLSPDLCAKNEVSVLLTMGRLHHPTFTEELNQLGFDIVALVQGDETVNNEEQLVRAHMLGRIPVRETIARAFLEDRINQVRSEPMREESGYSDTKWLAYVGKAAAAFDVEEIRPVHSMLRNHKWTVAAADELLVSKGLAPLPKTTEDLNAAVTLS